MTGLTAQNTSTFAYMDTRWFSEGISTQIRKALRTIGTTNLHMDPKMGGPIRKVATSMSITITDAPADWTTKGGAIERNKTVLSSLVTSCLIVCDDLKADRWGANLLRQCRNHNVQAYILNSTGLHVIDMATIPHYVYTEVDDTPFVLGKPVSIDPSIFVNAS